MKVKLYTFAKPRSGQVKGNNIASLKLCTPYGGGLQSKPLSVANRFLDLYTSTRLSQPNQNCLVFLTVDYQKNKKIVRTIQVGLLQHLPILGMPPKGGTGL
jgi:hypothetical protein